MRKSKIESIIIILLIIGGIVFGYYKYVLARQINDINTAQKAINSNQSTLTKLQNIVNNKNGTLLEIARAENKAAALDKAIPAGSNNYNFVMELYNTLKAYGLTSKNLEPQKPTENGGFTTQMINISVSGKNNNVISFVKYLQDNPRRIQIKEFSVRQTTVDEMDANIKINICSQNG